MSKKNILTTTHRTIAELLVAARLVSDLPEAKRMLEQNAVRLNGKPITGLDDWVLCGNPPSGDHTLQVGKRRSCTFRFA